jgi:hypothetical protein
MLRSQLFNFIVISFLAAGCSSGFQTDSNVLNPSLEDPSNSGLGNPGNTLDASLVWQKAQEEIDGQISGGTYDGSSAVEIIPEKQSIALILPLPPIFLAPLAQIQIPQLPGVNIKYRNKPDGGFEMAIIIPLKYIIRGASLAPYGKLPNGDIVPFMPSGESRGFAVDFPQKPKYRLHFYFVANAVGAFIETPDWRLPEEFSLIPTIGFPVRNPSQTQINGYFAVVPNKGNFSSGLFVSSRIPRKLAFQLDQILRY